MSEAGHKLRKEITGHSGRRSFVPGNSPGVIVPEMMDRIIERKGIIRRKLTILLSTAGVLALLLFAYFSATGVKRVKVKGERLTVSVVSESAFREFIPVTGTIQPIRTVMIDATEGGTIMEIFVEDGKIVEAGEPILRLSNPQLQMDAINREAQLLDQQNNLRSTRIAMEQKTVSLKEELLQVEHQIRQAERLMKQNEALDKDKLVAKNELDQSRDEYRYLLERKKLISANIRNDSLFRLTQVGQIESSLILIHKNLQFLQSNLQSLVVRAPVSGQLSSLRAELGQTKARGESIAQIDQTHDYKVKVRIGEHYLSRVAVGQQAEFTLAGESFHLIINKIFPEVSNGEFEADMFFTGVKPPSIRRGQSLQIRLALGDETKALLLPRGGFYQDTGGNWVYVLSGDNTAVKRTIRLGRQNPDYYEVTEGLYPGDRVVTSRYDAFNNADELIIE